MVSIKRPGRLRTKWTDRLCRDNNNVPTELRLCGWNELFQLRFTGTYNVIYYCPVLSMVSLGENLHVPIY